VAEPATPHFSFDIHVDPYAPKEMAGRAQTVGVAKARLDLVTTLTLGLLGGAFIGVGAELSTIAGTASGLGYGPARLLAGLAFSIGLILVIIAGAELFTGNTLIIMAWLGGKVSARLLLRNWVLVYAGNFAGAVVTAVLVYLSGQWAFSGNQVGATALSIAAAKVNLSFSEAVVRGILCNALVTLAVWLCFSARSNVDKIFSIIPPITAFVASGFEHSIANMYFIPLGLLLRTQPAVVEAAALPPDALANLTLSGFLVDNLLPVTIGNILGGTVLVGGVYWLVYLRPFWRAAAE
jgi:formate transporter